MNSRRNEHLNLLGQRFGQLTVIEELPYRIDKRGKREYMWLCKCDCGETIVKTTHLLRQGKFNRCQSCYLKESSNKRLKENETTPRFKENLYNLWIGIKQRCYNPNNNEYYLYGGRGIKMCDEWKNDYKSFYNWAMDNGYSKTADHKKDCTIDRIDVDGNYEPDNCRWATAKQQMRNRRCTVFCNYNGKQIPLAEAADILNVKWTKLYHQWRKNKSIDVSTLFM